MSGFTPWWESHLPAYIIIYCREGEAELKLLFKNHILRKGMIAIISPDMYPSFTSRSETFTAFYCLTDRDFTEKSLYGVPNGFYDTIYVAPVLPVEDSMDRWMDLLKDFDENSMNLFRHDILSHILHAFALDYYDKWKRHYNNLTSEDNKNSADVICMKYYNLIFDHFREHRNIAYYADILCITPNYLAMIVRKICNETPKQAIDRLITLEMKHLLRNTTLTIEQIADQLHFPDTSYMCRVFRRQTGVSPLKYREKDL